MKWLGAAVAVLLAGVTALIVWVDVSPDDSFDPVQAVIEKCHASSAHLFSGPDSVLATSRADAAFKANAIETEVAVLWTQRGDGAAAHHVALIDTSDGKYRVSTCG